MARILVVEDDESVRYFTSRALMRDGHTVDAAEDGDIGLEMIEAAEGGYDLILSDIRMPTMDGIALARAVAERYPSMTILLMTGYAEQREAAADLQDIIVDVLPKPFQLVQLRDYVALALGERQAA